VSNKYELFNKVVNASLLQWIDTHRKNNDGEVPDILMRVRTQAFNTKALNEFTDEEVDILKQIETDPEFMGIKAEEISYLVHALIVLKLWVEDIPKNKRPRYNINEGKMKIGKAAYLKHMLLAKKHDPSLYASEKGIIDDTEDAAYKWFEYFKNQLIKE